MSGIKKGMYKIDSPVFINSVFHTFCKNCQIVKLALKENTLIADGKTVKSYDLTCENYETCERIESAIRKSMEEEEDDCYE